MSKENKYKICTSECEDYDESGLEVGLGCLLW